MEDHCLLLESISKMRLSAHAGVANRFKMLTCYRVCSAFESICALPWTLIHIFEMDSRSHVGSGIRSGFPRNEGYMEEREKPCLRSTTLWTSRTSEYEDFLTRDDRNLLIVGLNMTNCPWWVNKIVITVGCAGWTRKAQRMPSILILSAASTFGLLRDWVSRI